MVNRTKKRRSLPPSRARYEASHPTISVRVSRDLYDQLKAVAATLGLSMADILKVGMEKVQATAQKAYNKGEQEGFDIAREMFEVTYWCARCHQRHLSVDSEEQIEAAANLMYQAGWHDPKCR